MRLRRSLITEFQASDLCTQCHFLPGRQHALAATPLATISAHVRLDSLHAWPQVLRELTAVAGKLGIRHVTFQPESLTAAQPIQFKPR